MPVVVVRGGKSGVSGAVFGAVEPISREKVVIFTHLFELNQFSNIEDKQDRIRNKCEGLDHNESHVAFAATEGLVCPPINIRSWDIAKQIVAKVSN